MPRYYVRLKGLDALGPYKDKKKAESAAEAYSTILQTKAEVVEVEGRENGVWG